MSNVFGAYGRSFLGPSRQVTYNSSAGAVVTVTFTRVPELPALFMLTPRTADARILNGEILANRASGIVRTLCLANVHYPMLVVTLTSGNFEVISNTTTAGTLEVALVSLPDDFFMDTV